MTTSFYVRCYAWVLCFFIFLGATTITLAQNSGSPDEGAPQAKNQRWVNEGRNILYAFPIDTKVWVGLSNPAKAFEVAGETRLHGQVGLDSNLLLQGDLHLSNSIWTSDGFLGIGTVDPQFNLDVVGNSRFDGAAQFLQSVHYKGETEFDNTVSFNSDVNLPGSGVWNASGQVGIGTTTPGYMLEVAGTAHFQEKALFGSEAEFLGILAAKDRLQVEGSTRLSGDATIDSSLSVSGSSSFDGSADFGNEVSLPMGIWTNEGHLGIGTETPTNQLDVDGTARFRGATQFEDASRFMEQAQFNAGVTMSRDLSIGNKLTVSGRTVIEGEASFDSSLAVSGPATFRGTSEFSSDLSVEGITQFNKDVYFSNGVWSSDGRLVIGGMTAAEDYQLQVKGKMDAEKLSLDGIPIKKAVAIWNEQNSGDIVFTDGNVGIGTTAPDSVYKLSVSGKIRSKEVVVEAGWADFVFEDDYKLRSLQEVEKYIQAHGHLPEIPSEEQVREEGIGVGAIQSKLLLKIEELTLYSIQQKKQIKQLKKLIDQQQQVLNQLQEQIQK